MIDTKTDAHPPPASCCNACVYDFHDRCTGHLATCCCTCPRAVQARLAADPLPFAPDDVAHPARLPEPVHDHPQPPTVPLATAPPVPATAPPAEPADQSITGQRSLAVAHPPWSPARLAYAFYGVAAGGAVIGQVWVALTRIPWDSAWPMWARIAAVLPFALCLELLAMALAAMGDHRQGLGERAYGFRLFSALVAVVAVGVLVAGHWPHPYQVVAFGALSTSAYVLWLLHAGARRRDALRAAGKLAATAPAYGLHRWCPLLGNPGWRVTRRAAELAREQGLALYPSLRAAELAIRAERRRPALAAAVERAVRADQDDPLLAEIEARTLDLDAIALELEKRADYGWWADRLSPRRTEPGTDLSSPAAISGTASGTPDPASGKASGTRSGTPDRTSGQASRTGSGTPDARSAAASANARARRRARPTRTRPDAWDRETAEREYRTSATAGTPMTPAELARRAGRDPKTAWRWINDWASDSTPDASGEQR